MPLLHPPYIDNTIEEPKKRSCLKACSVSCLSILKFSCSHWFDTHIQKVNIFCSNFILTIQIVFCLFYMQSTTLSFFHFPNIFFYVAYFYRLGCVYLIWTLRTNEIFSCITKNPWKSTLECQSLSTVSSCYLKCTCFFCQKYSFKYAVGSCLWIDIL